MQEENSEKWKAEYIKACKETGTISCDSASSRIDGNPMSWKQRAEAVRALSKFSETLRLAANEADNKLKS